MYNWIIMLNIWNQYNIVSQLYSKNFFLNFSEKKKDFSCTVGLNQGLLTSNSQVQILKKNKRP